MLAQKFASALLELVVFIIVKGNGSKGLLRSASKTFVNILLWR